MAKTDIYVYAHWKGMEKPLPIGVLSANYAKNKKAFSFTYDNDWLHSGAQFLLDPEIQWFTGPQYRDGHENFGVFMDPMPDTWGRTLLLRRAAEEAKLSGTPNKTLYDTDYLLGVHDFTRMGALRFKLDPEGPFLDDDNGRPTPPWAHIRELQESAAQFEANDGKHKKWLQLLIAPGSSLGGARPKANILDDQRQLWIAKFPSKNDTIDKAAWEMLTHRLAVSAGIEMAPCKLEKVSAPYHTFFTKRFDRDGEDRVHFASAMTLLGRTEATNKDEAPSYLELAEFIQANGGFIEQDLHQLWRRLVFNMSVSNTDDHLRNHGFILAAEGWRLSPAFDLNPSVEKDGLSLNVDMTDNALDYELAMSVGMYFRLSGPEMKKIIAEVKTAVRSWDKVANSLHIARSEREIMAPAFALAMH